MGYLPIGGIEAIKSVTLTAILFIGPLFEAGIAEGAWRDWIHLRGVDVVIRSWIGWRNMIAVRFLLSIIMPSVLTSSRGR